MTPKKQVSPAIRILRGERDASARATHLEAATRKFLVTTNERKYMSTKTNFKRIALVAVAALGLGVLSSVPSQAVNSSGITITTTAGTATTILADSTTAASVTIKWQSVSASDSVVLTAALKSKPALGTAPNVVFSGKDTATAVAATVLAPGSSTTTFTGGVTPGSTADGGYSTTSHFRDSAVATSAVGYNSATFRVQMDSLTSTARVAGTYVYTITAYPVSYTQEATSGRSISEFSRAVTADVTITIDALASESTVASAATSTAFIGTTAGAKTTDASVSVPAAVSSTDTPRAYIYTLLKNAAGAAAGESITVTTNIGNVGSAAARGKSVVLSSNGTTDIFIYSDGTAGTATITVKSTSVTFASKTVVFYAAAPTSIVASALNSTPGVTTNPAALGVVAKDANGNIYGGTLYVSSSALTVISDTATACTYNSTNSRHECSLTGLMGGTAVITVRDAATAPTISSNAVSFTVSANSPASVKLSFDKATYAPGEKATLLVSVLDSAGKSVAANTFANLFATGGITLSSAAGNGSETVTAISATTVSLASYALGTLTDPVKAFTIYMPSSGGTITAKATGGSSLPLTGQVAVTATATVTDSGAAALAAVTALATTVASLRTLITTLTNLVLKIQKKVKA
jgi:hypothetical protein